MTKGREKVTRHYDMRAPERIANFDPDDADDCRDRDERQLLMAEIAERVRLHLADTPTHEWTPELWDAAYDRARAQMKSDRRNGRPLLVDRFRRVQQATARPRGRPRDVTDANLRAAIDALPRATRRSARSTARILAPKFPGYSPDYLRKRITNLR